LIEKSGSAYYTLLVNPYGAGFIYIYGSTSLTSGSVIINSRNHFGRTVSLKGGTVTKYSVWRNDLHERLLTGAVSSLGVIDRNYYRKPDEGGYFYPTGYFYQKGSGAVFPHINFSGPMHVPVTREKYHDSRLYENINFGYENAVMHVQGLGFHGFGRMTTYGRIRGREFTRTFDPYRFGVLTAEESLFSKTANNWTVNVQLNKTVRTP
jgi:hypothetical protein